MKILNFLSSISHSSCEIKIVHEMENYRDSRIADEFKKKTRRENDIAKNGTSKVEMWNEQITNTVFLWHREVIRLDYKLDEMFLLKTLNSFVEEEMLERHPEYKACYYLPLNK